jgi:hypothetical protein
VSSAGAIHRVSGSAGSGSAGQGSSSADDGDDTADADECAALDTCCSSFPASVTDLVDECRMIVAEHDVPACGRALAGYKRGYVGDKGVTTSFC